MAYKTDQSGFSWGKQGKELEAWRRRSQAAKNSAEKAAETKSKRQAALQEYKSRDEYKGLRKDHGAYLRFTSIMDMLSKSGRKFIRETYSSGDILEAAEEIIDKNPDKYISKKNITNYVENVIKKRKAKDTGIDWDNPT